MRHLIGSMVTVFVVLWIGASAAAAQDSRPADSPPHSVIGTVTRVSNSSFWLKDFIKVGDEATVSYRENNGVLTAVRVNVRPKTQKN